MLQMLLWQFYPSMFPYVDEGCCCVEESKGQEEEEYYSLFDLLSLRFAQQSATRKTRQREIKGNRTAVGRRTTAFLNAHDQWFSRLLKVLQCYQIHCCVSSLLNVRC